MRRFAVLFLAVLLFAAPAFAGHWVTKEIKWRVSSVGSPISATAIYVRDTTYQALGGTAGGDTTADFTLNYAGPIPRGMASPAGQVGDVGVTTGTGASSWGYQSDSTTVAWLVVQQDTSVAFVPTATSVTAIIDGRVGAFGPPITLARGWVKADSSFINGAAGGTLTTGDESVALPIRTISPYGNIFRWNILRARISPATGTMAGARIWLRYWTDSDLEAGP